VLSSRLRKRDKEEEQTKSTKRALQIHNQEAYAVRNLIKIPNSRCTIIIPLNCVWSGDLVWSNKSSRPCHCPPTTIPFAY